MGPVDYWDVEDFKKACKNHGSTLIFTSKFNDDDYLRLPDIQSYKSLYLSNDINFTPIKYIETDRDNSVLNAISRGTARIIIVRNDLLK